MVDLNVWHLIYTRVEPEYSPTRKNGFQTVYFSPEIKDEVDAIERQVQCFIPGSTHVEQATAEYQYFWTEKGNAVIAHTVAVERDPQVIDAAAGRTGHFITHGLVISREQFARVANDPFAVINGAHKEGVFTDSVELLVQYLREAPPPSRLKASKRSKLEDTQPDWTVDMLERWAALAQTASDLTAKKGSLLLLSEDSDMIYALLSAASYLMDAERRAACTFNTFIDGCVPSAGMYWVVGSRKRVSGSGFTTVDLSTNTMEVKQQNSPKTSPYLAWLRQKSKSYVGFSEGMSEIYAAQIAAECLAAKRPLPDEPLLETALTTFREVNLERYQSGLMKALTAELGKTIAEQLAPDLISLAGIRVVVDAGAQETIDHHMFAPVIYEWAVKQHTTIKAWKDLLHFAQTAGHKPLITLAGAKAPSNILFGNKSAKASAEALDELAQRGELPHWLPDFQTVLEAQDIVTASTARIVATELNPDALSDEYFTNLTAALIKTDAFVIDSRFTTRVGRLADKKHLQTLSKLVKKASRLDSRFIQALQEKS